MERHRTGGMTTIAVLDIVFGSVEILKGIFHTAVAIRLMSELSRLGVFYIPWARVALPLLLFATAIVGLIAGIALLTLRSWARPLNLLFAGLLILSSVVSYLTVPVLSSIGTYDLGSLSPDNLARLITFVILYLAFPVPYALLLCAVFHKPDGRLPFAKS